MLTNAITFNSCAVLCIKVYKGMDNNNRRNKINVPASNAVNMDLISLAWKVSKFNLCLKILRTISDAVIPDIKNKIASE